MVKRWSWQDNANIKFAILYETALDTRLYVCENAEIVFDFREDVHKIACSGSYFTFSAVGKRYHLTSLCSF